MKVEKYNYLIVENAIDVCAGITRRMKNFDKWESVGYCTSAKEAIDKIINLKPHLIFLDWSLNGGSAFDVLQQIQNLNNYNPYIIFNTGYQSDHPEIPQELINNYHVDKYLVKPFWENLRQFLHEYLLEAEQKLKAPDSKSKIVWAENGNGSKVPVSLNNIVCIIQNPEHPRKRDVYILGNNRPITVLLTWEKCYELLEINRINYFVTKFREHLVVKNFIERFDKPFIRIRNYPFKIPVVKERMTDFAAWLEK